MIRSSVDLPQPDGPISETNSPAAMSRSIPASAVVIGWSPRANTLSTPARRTTGWSVMRAGLLGRRSGMVSRGLRRAAVAEDDHSTATISRKNRRPSSAAATIAAQSFSGPVM